MDDVKLAKMTDIEFVWNSEGIDNKFKQIPKQEPSIDSALFAAFSSYILIERKGVYCTLLIRV